MTTPAARPLLTPEEIAVRAGEQAPFLRFAERSTVFGEREMRLRQLAAGHAMGDYLRFVAEIAKAQADVLRDKVEAALPTDEQIGAAARQGLPLFDAMRASGGAQPGFDWKQGGAWLVALRRVLGRLAEGLAAGPQLDAVSNLAAADDAHLEAQAERLLSGVMLGLDLGTAPLIGAGLQVWFAHLVLATQEARAGQRDEAFGRIDDETRCPCCGSLPTSGVVRIGAAEAGFRYLACSLCSTQWHMVRIKCSHCLSTKGISTQSLRSLAEEEQTTASGFGETRASAMQGAGAVARAIQAECCSECGHYLKMLHMERDPHVDPIADDLASVTLDLLVSEGGLVRHGVNLMLLFGDPDATADPGSG